jgi:hypothetical protein
MSWPIHTQKWSKISTEQPAWWVQEPSRHFREHKNLWPLAGIKLWVIQPITLSLHQKMYPGCWHYTVINEKYLWTVKREAGRNQGLPSIHTEYSEEKAENLDQQNWFFPSEKTKLNVITGIWKLKMFKWSEETKYTGWSKRPCAPDDYNTESYK